MRKGGGDVYRNIHAEREKIGISVGALASAIGVSRPTLRSWINGETPIPSDKLISLSALFGCTIDYLLQAYEKAG